MVVECICADRSFIPPLVLFKGATLSSDWIPTRQMATGWRFSCSNKGWTNNILDMQWLRRCFELSREKAGNNARVLILDGYESHTTGKFIAHCMEYNIHLLRLPLHTSHLLQPLDVDLFAPLKKALSAELDPLIRTGVTKIKKSEWVLRYAKGRKKVFSIDNVFGGWRGAGLFPYDPAKVLRHIKSIPDDSQSSQLCATPATPFSSIPFDWSFVHSSPPDAALFHASNTALIHSISHQAPLKTPERWFIPRLAKYSESLLADNHLLQKDNEEMRKIVTARREPTTGKRFKLKNKLILTDEELCNAVEAFEKEKADRQVKKAKGREKRKVVEMESETDSNDDTDEEEEVLEQLLQDCIVVAPIESS